VSPRAGIKNIRNLNDILYDPIVGFALITLGGLSIQLRGLMATQFSKGLPGRTNATVRRMATFGLLIGLILVGLGVLRVFNFNSPGGTPCCAVSPPRLLIALGAFSLVFHRRLVDCVAGFSLFSQVPVSDGGTKSSTYS